MLTTETFNLLIEAASKAPSADNMQPWEFRKQGDTIEVFICESRKLPQDAMDMFAWVGIGAAIQNIVNAAAKLGMQAKVDYQSDSKDRAAVISFLEHSGESHYADYIPLRNTNRCPFEAQKLSSETITKLTKNLESFHAKVHWTTNAEDFTKMAMMDAKSTYIRLEHKPLHDELFSILRFTNKDVDTYRFGLTFQSLEVPDFAVFFAKQLRYWSVNKLVSKLGFGRMIAKQLSNKLKQAGAICLLTSVERTPVGYMEAGRAMEQLWLAATAKGLSVQPYGVLPQYLTKSEIEPHTFLPKYVDILNRHRKTFYSVFPDAKNEFPAIVLRIGKTDEVSYRSDVRLRNGEIVRN